MNVLHLPRARTAAAVWASIGLVGIAIALYAVLSLMGSRGLLPWQIGSGDIGRQIIRFLAGVSLSGLALWGMYKQTIHARDDMQH